MLRCKILAVLLLGCSTAQAQELFVYTEPASNMPAKSVGIRLSNWIMDEQYTSRTNYHLIPEVMWGVNKNLMVHMEGYISNRSSQLVAEGGAVYAKYRFFSRDNMYRHTRMAGFVRLTTNNADIHQEEIATNGHNSGYQLGMIGTQLLHKTALSSTVYYEQALDNRAGNEFPAAQANKAVNYTLSAGRLVLPKTYTGYKQVNMNVMLELWGQTLIGNGKSYLDIAPSVQFIFNSQTRVDVGYKHQLYGNMVRTAPNGLLVRVEHLLFNVL
ncbi:MAG: hypothetical protein V4649_20070 [Bacteroidota bacterium]